MKYVINKGLFKDGRYEIYPYIHTGYNTSAVMVFETSGIALTGDIRVFNAASGMMELGYIDPTTCNLYELCIRVAEIFDLRGYPG